MTLDIAGIFGAGLLTFLTPCVLPLIPIYLAALVGGDITTSEGTSRGAMMWRASLFALGFIAVFTVMGLTASALGGLVAEYKATFQIGGALLILIFGFKFLGLINIPLFDRIVRGNDSKMQTRFGWANALIMGVVFAIGWSPCVGPVLGSVLTYTATATADPLLGAAYLATYGFGFAVPLLLTAAFFEGARHLLKRFYPWMPMIERGMGALLVIVAGSLLWDQALVLNASEQANVSAAAPGEQAGLSADALAKAQAVPMMLELYSENCPICRQMKPMVERITNQCDGKEVRIILADISKAENRHYVAEHRLVGVPTFIFLDAEGNEAARLVGHQTEAALMQALSAVRGETCPGLGPVPDLPTQPAAQESSGTACGVAGAIAETDDGAGAEGSGSCEQGTL